MVRWYLSTKVVLPVTMGGNIRFRVRGGRNDMNISRTEHINDVPNSSGEHSKVGGG